MADGGANSSDAVSGAAPGSGASAKAGNSSGLTRPLWLAALAAVVTLLALYGVYSRSRSEVPGADSPASPAALFQQSQAVGTSLTAVGRTVGLDQPCTAWLVDAGAPGDARAWAVTSARCVGHTDPTSVLAGQDLTDATVEFNALAPSTTGRRADVVQAPIEAVEWASVRGTDLAVVRLVATYDELAGRGVRPIDPVPASEQGAEILIAGVPVEGVAPSQQYLRGSRCQVGDTADVLEDALLLDDAQGSDCGGILGGSQGSPVLNAAGAAVAMVTTTTIAAQEETECALGLPCQVSDDGGVSVKEDTSYMVPVAALAQCFSEGTLTLGGDCALEDPASVLPARAVTSVARPGSTVEIQLEGALPDGFASTAAIEVKQGELGTVDCTEPEGWLPAAVAAAQAAEDAGVVEVAASAAPSASASTAPGASADPKTSADPGTPADPEASAEPAASPGAGAAAGSDVVAPTPPGLWSYPVILPADEGFTLVCVGSPAQPTSVVIKADGTPPDPATIELTTTQVEGGVQVEPVFDPPELAGFRWVSGPADSIDCATAEGYVEYRRVPATIQAADLPSTVCVIAIDEAGNESKPAAIKVE
jgi:preprotein translocase subunit SecG